MAKKVTKWMASDSTLWDTKDAADTHDWKTLARKEIEIELGEITVYGHVDEDTLMEHLCTGKLGIAVMHYVRGRNSL